MPLPKDSRFVSRISQHLRERRGRQGHELPLLDRMGHSISEFMPTAQDGRPRRRAGGTHMELGESRRQAIETIEVGRSQERVAETAQVSHPLIIRHYKNDTGASPFQRLRLDRERTEQCKDQKQRNWWGFHSRSVEQIKISTTLFSAIASSSPTRA